MYENSSLSGNFRSFVHLDLYFFFMNTGSEERYEMKQNSPTKFQCGLPMQYFAKFNSRKRKHDTYIVATFSRWQICEE
jgi:hypothetical protein